MLSVLVGTKWKQKDTGIIFLVTAARIGLEGAEAFLGGTWIDFTSLQAGYECLQALDWRIYVGRS